MPTPTVYFCNECDFSSSTFSTWGAHYYKSDNTEVPIGTRLAICYTCERVTVVENLPSYKRLISLTKKDIETEAEKEWKRLNLLLKRESPPRCLNCGTHDFNIIPRPNPYNSKEDKWNTELDHHSNCTGTIMGKRGVANFFMGNKLEPKYYDLEGTLIKQPNPNNC